MLCRRRVAACHCSRFVGRFANAVCEGAGALREFVSPQRPSGVVFPWAARFIASYGSFCLLRAPSSIGCAFLSSSLDLLCFAYPSPQKQKHMLRHEARPDCLDIGAPVLLGREGQQVLVHGWAPNVCSRAWRYCPGVKSLVARWIRPGPESISQACQSLRRLKCVKQLAANSSVSHIQHGKSARTAGSAPRRIRPGVGAACRPINPRWCYCSHMRRAPTIWRTASSNRAGNDIPLPCGLGTPICMPAACPCHSEAPFFKLEACA